jgi:hypothetical protein
MPDFTAKLDALRQISTLLSQKGGGDVPDDLWGKAGLKPGSRLKDVSNEITKTKKLVSSQVRSTGEDEGSEGEDAPGPKSANAPGHRQDARVKKDVRKLGADTKSNQQALARGDFDLKVTKLFHGSDGALHDADAD